ncbi:MAG: hypothetical protein WCC39_08385, partial [Telluria sp.]
HALLIHPLFWVLPLCAFSLYVMFAKTDGEKLLRYIFLPLLRFAEHLFGIALGVCLIIGTIEICALDKAAKVKAVLILLAVVWYFLFAALYTVAANATEDIKRAGRMNARIFWTYTVLFGLSLIILFNEILPNDPAAKDVANIAVAAVEWALK